jgi:tRNA-specific 2-thiouridylase
MQLVDRLAGQTERYGRCCSPDDFRDARAVADRIGFPHYILDMEEEFHRTVLQPFADEYAAGRTPSPCVLCNTHVKFGALLARARAVGAETVATGHYAILERDAASGRTLLRRARDREKDQSYFLFDLSEEQRRRAEFPLGTMTKAEVRAVAREQGLATAAKPESMDLCFVSRQGDYRDFLDRRAADRVRPRRAAGEIVNREGEVLGRHAGVERFTVGQRRGIGVTSDRPLYVLALDPRAGKVVVGGEEELLRDRCIIEDSRWIPFDGPGGAVRARVRIRSTQEGAPATVRDLGHGRAEIRFEDPQRAITPGQAAVAYDGDLVLGGGWIAA